MAQQTLAISSAAPGVSAVVIASGLNRALALASHHRTFIVMDLFSGSRQSNLMAFVGIAMATSFDVGS